MILSIFLLGLRMPSPSFATVTVIVQETLLGLTPEFQLNDCSIFEAMHDQSKLFLFIPDRSIFKVIWLLRAGW